MLKKISKQIERWRYKRLYRKLLREYIPKFKYAEHAKAQADFIFFCLTGLEWDISCDSSVPCPYLDYGARFTTSGLPFGWVYVDSRNSE